MKRNRLFLVIAAALMSAAVVACGDNSKQCGDGTTDKNGQCVFGGCTDGTILVNGACEIDPNSCQDGTVLVDGACVDPGHVNVDIEEEAEPNALGLLGENSTNPAGMASIKPVGQSLVIHGKIIPFRDLTDGTAAGAPDGQPDPDVDTYVLQTDGPALVNVSADGLHGLNGAFLSIAVTNDKLSKWTRIGVNLTGDTSKRQLFFPEAGIYALAVADTRSLFTGSAAGAEDGALAFEYYVTITQVNATATPLTPNTAGLASATGQLAAGEVKLFTVPMGTGINSATLDVANGAVVESVVITNTRTGNLTVKGYAEADTNAGTPATATALGIKTGDTTLIVADHVQNFLAGDVDFELKVRAGDAGALPTNNTAVSQPAGPSPTTVEPDRSAFFYDVGADLEIRGMNIAFTDENDDQLPVAGFVLDEDGNVFANFVFDPLAAQILGDGFFFGDTFTDYEGLLRHPVAGRYYFVVFDPSETATTITATSTHAALTVNAVVKDTPLANVSINAFESNPFTYNAGLTDAWQLLEATGTNTGAITKTFFDPGVVTFGNPGFAFGRLDDLNTTCPPPSCDDATPLFVQVSNNTEAGQGRVLLKDKPFLDAKNFLFTVNTASVAGNPTFTLNFARRAHTAVPVVAGAQPVVTAAAALDGGTVVQRYLITTDEGNNVKFVLTPSVAINTRFQLLQEDESTRGLLTDPTPNNGATDTAELITGERFVAMEVTQSGAGSGTVSMAASATNPTVYTLTNGSTAFADACTGGAPIVFNPNANEGASAVIATPGAFKFFGLLAPQLRVFTNGFVTFDSALACPGANCFKSPADLPSEAGPNAIAAPYWDDVNVTSACQKTVAGALVIQWTGTVAGAVVAFQVILDGTLNTIEFVYRNTQVPTGATAGIGIENQIGTAANKVGFKTTGAITPGGSKLFTPN